MEDLTVTKELVNYIRKGLEIGCEAVMHGDIALYDSLPSTQQTYDPVKVSEPNLSVYDKLLGNGVSA